MKTLWKKLLLLSPVLLMFSACRVAANGCTGSNFNMVYSPWCGCWQVCGDYISDCDQLVSLSWNFGDGTTATGPSPCHVFANPGTYTVTMTVVAYCHNFLFNIFTTTCYITQTVTVTSTANPLQANFTADTVCLTQGT